jgi:pimeloyl-ACP methyl ester carboxylesterase
MDELIDMPPADPFPVSGEAFPLVSVGTGEAVLFVHGAWADHQIWHAAWRQVSARHRFLAYTQRHFGASDWTNERPYSRDVHAADLVAIVIALDEPVNLVGWSYAGGIILRAALEVPHLVRSVVLYDPSLPELVPDSAEGRQAADQFWEGLQPAYAAARAGDFVAGMRGGLEFLFGLPDGGFESLDESSQGVFLANTHTMFPDLEAPVPAPWTRAQLERIRKPVLLVSGDGSHSVYKLEARSLLDSIPSATVETIAGAGHGGPVMSSDAFVILALEFIDSSARRSSCLSPDP